MTNSPFFPSNNFAEWSQLNRTDDHTPARRTATGRIEGRADSLGEWSGWWGGRIWSTARSSSNRQADATGRWVALGTEGRRVQVPLSSGPLAIFSPSGGTRHWPPVSARPRDEVWWIGDQRRLGWNLALPEAGRRGCAFIYRVCWFEVSLRRTRHTSSGITLYLFWSIRNCGRPWRSRRVRWSTLMPRLW